MKKNAHSKLLVIFFVIYTFSSISAQSGSIQEKDSWNQPFKLCWIYPSDEVLANYIASDNVRLFTPYLSGNVKAINLTDGKIIWTTELGGEITSNIAADNKNIYIVNKTAQTEKSQPNSQTTSSTNILNTYLRALDSNSGITIWKKLFNLDSNASLQSLENSLILNTENGHLKAIDKQNGINLWETDLKQTISVISYSEDTIIIGTFNKKIFLISSINGTIIKEFDVNDIPIGILQLNRETIYWGDNKGFLNSLSVSMSNTVWKRRFGGETTSITHTYRGLLITSIDNFIYMVSYNNGKIIWKRRLAARVVEKPFIKDNLAVVFAFGDSNVFFIELEKGKIMNSLTLSDANFFTGNLQNASHVLVFPTLQGLYAFSGSCVGK